MDHMGQGRQVQLEMKIAARVVSSGISFRTGTSQNAQLSRLMLLIFSETRQKRGREKYFNWHSLRIFIGILCETIRLVKEYLTKKESFQYAPPSSPSAPTYTLISLFGGFFLTNPVVRKSDISPFCQVVKGIPYWHSPLNKVRFNDRMR